MVRWVPLRVLLIEDLKQVLNNGETHFLLVEDGTVQGSKIGSRMYKIYVEPLGKLLKNSPCSNHGYADDKSAWKVASPASEMDVQLGLHSLEHTLADVRTWMLTNKLCLVITRTELVLLDRFGTLFRFN